MGGLEVVGVVGIDSGRLVEVVDMFGLDLELVEVVDVVGIDSGKLVKVVGVAGLDLVLVEVVETVGLDSIHLLVTLSRECCVISTYPTSCSLSL